MHPLMMRDPMEIVLGSGFTSTEFFVEIFLQFVRDSVQELGVFDVAAAPEVAPLLYSPHAPEESAGVPVINSPCTPSLTTTAVCCCETDADEELAGCAVAAMYSGLVLACAVLAAVG